MSPMLQHTEVGLKREPIAHPTAESGLLHLVWYVGTHVCLIQLHIHLHMPMPLPIHIHVYIYMVSSPHIYKKDQDIVPDQATRDHRLKHCGSQPSHLQLVSSSRPPRSMLGGSWDLATTYKRACNPACTLPALYRLPQFAESHEPQSHLDEHGMPVSTEVLRLRRQRLPSRTSTSEPVQSRPACGFMPLLGCSGSLLGGPSIRGSEPLAGQ